MVTAMPISRAAGKLLLIFLHFIQIMLVISSIGILFTRDSFTPISVDLFGSDAPLMNSVWLDLLMRPVLSIPIVLLLGGFLYFRRQAVSKHHKLALDVASTAAMAGWISILLLGLYAPASLG